MRIELHDIHKYYGASRANNGISLTIEPGTIHGILGENGAGKSTLMKIMAGTIRKNRGTIRINGLAADYSHPDQAMKLGMGMLYQDPLDFPSLTVLENFMLGQTSGVRIRKRFFQRRLSPFIGAVRLFAESRCPRKKPDHRRKTATGAVKASGPGR